MNEHLQRCESHVTTKARRAMEEDKEMMSSKRRKLNRELKTDGLRGGEAGPTTESSVSPAASGPDSGGSEKHEDDYSGDTVGKGNPVFCRETTPTSELYGDSEEILLQSFSKLKKKKPSEKRRISHREISEKTPAAAELEEFFAAAEKYDQKLFAEKYNYDIAGDVPLEGKYQWVVYYSNYINRCDLITL